MATSPKSNKQPLKGLRLYNYLIQQVGIANASVVGMPKLTIQQKRSIVNQELFQKFKSQPKLNKNTIKKEVRIVVKGKPTGVGKKEPPFVNVAILPSTSLLPINYFELDSTLKQLKLDYPRLQVKVTSVTFGSSPVFLLENFDYSGLKFIVDSIGKAAEHMSGVYEFIPTPVISGNYLDFVLANEDELDDEDIMPDTAAKNRVIRTEAELAERALGTKKIIEKRAAKKVKEKAIKRSKSSLLRDPLYKEANLKYKESVKRAERLYKNKDIEEEDYKVLLHAAAERKAKVIKELNSK